MFSRGSLVVDFRQGKRITLLQPSELFPGHLAFAVAAVEPFAPGSTHLVAKVRGAGCPDTTQDSLPAAGQALPDGTLTRKGSDERFPSQLLIDFPLSRASWRNERLPVCEAWAVMAPELGSSLREDPGSRGRSDHGRPGHRVAPARWKRWQECSDSPAPQYGLIISRRRGDCGPVDGLG